MKHQHDETHTNWLGALLKVANGLIQYDIDSGLSTIESVDKASKGVRLTMEKRKEIAKTLVASGVSTRKAAKVTGVSQTQIRRDASPKGSKASPKGSENKPRSKANADRDRAKEGDWDWGISLVSKALIDASRFIHVVNEYEMNETRKGRVLDIIKELREQADKLERTINGQSPTALTSIKGGKS